MRKVFSIILLFFAAVQFAVANTISYDKSGFEKISNVITDASFDIRYYTSNNFTGRPVKGYKTPTAYLTKEALNALSIAAADLRKQGYRILIFDAYRPQKAVDDFVSWANNPNEKGNKSYFPNISKTDILNRGFIAKKSGHSRGSTVDLTIIKKDGSYVDMGGSFDFFGNVSHTFYPNLTVEQKKNREILRTAMLNAGFRGVSGEWWHYTFKNEPYPDTYFNFDIE